MKLLDIDWLDFYHRLAVWNRLTLTTRQVLAKLKSNESVNPAKFGDDLRSLAAAGFVTVYVDGQRAKWHKDSSSSFAQTIRAMCRNDILEQPNTTVLYNYIIEHFTYAEQAALAPPGSQAYQLCAHDLTHAAQSVRWVNDYLSLKNLEQAGEWESTRQPHDFPHGRDAGEAPSKGGEGLAITQSIIRDLMSSTEPASFSDLAARFAHVGLPLLAAATYTGIRYLLLFPSMRRSDMTPMITVWPAIPQRVLRSPAKPPKTVKPDQSFHCAFLMEDMTTVLVAASGDPPRIRSDDHALFAKAQQRLEASLAPVPEWLTQIGGCTPGERVLAAVDFLRKLRFIATLGIHGKDLRLEPTPEARDWLGVSSKDRLKCILDRLKPGRPKELKRRSKRVDSESELDVLDDLLRMPRRPLALAELEDDEEDEDIDDGYGYAHDRAAYAYDRLYDYRTQPELLPPTVSWARDLEGHVDVPGALIEAYGSLSGGRFVPLAQFVEYQKQRANPLLYRPAGAAPVRLRIGWSMRTPTDEEAEEHWGNLLVDFLRQRLVPLGGAEVGRMETDDGLCIALTDAGRYLLDLTKDFDYGRHQDQEGRIVVQPNFDVVFLSPAPLAEATIARFAHRKASGTGTLFTITKKSIFAAASGHLTAGQVLDTLQGHCANAVPANVTREIQEWFGQCGRVTIKSTLLIRCPNAEVATRVLAAGGKKLKPISATVVELADRKFKTTLVKKLREAGVFVDQSSQAAEPAANRRHGRRPW